MSIRAQRLALSAALFLTLFAPWGTHVPGYKAIWVILGEVPYWLQYPAPYWSILALVGAPILVVFNLVIALWSNPILLQIYRVILAIVTFGTLVAAFWYGVAFPQLVYGFWIYFALVCGACVMEVIPWWREGKLHR